jgi:hypothetical protein
MQQDCMQLLTVPLYGPRDDYLKQCVLLYCLKVACWPRSKLDARSRCPLSVRAHTCAVPATHVIEGHERILGDKVIVIV